MTNTTRTDKASATVAAKKLARENLIKIATAMVGCKCNHRGEEGEIIAYTEEYAPANPVMMVVMFGARRAILKVNEIGASS